MEDKLGLCSWSRLYDTSFPNRSSGCPCCPQIGPEESLQFVAMACVSTWMKIPLLAQLGNLVLLSQGPGQQVSPSCSLSLLDLLLLYFSLPDDLQDSE